MQNNIVIKAPAKLNLFLRILGQKNNGYHIIRTGITFINLYDVINISLSDINDLSYTGHFKPSSVIYKNDIIIKVLDKISLKKNIKINVKITKNIPWKAGLGSASTDAASLIKGLQKLGLMFLVHCYWVYLYAGPFYSDYCGANNVLLMLLLQILKLQ